MSEPANQNRILRWLPGLQVLRQYKSQWLPPDIVAGIVLSTMLVPVGIAYAEASGLPGIYGLYATIIPLLAYAVFGPSRILVMGPDSSLAAIILGTVLPLSGGDPARAVALAGAMAIVSGLVCILAGVARLGFITELLSKPIRYGYMNGIALTVLLSQTPKLLGFSIEGGGPGRDLFADRRRDFRRQDQLGHICDWRRSAGGYPSAEGQQARTWHSCCRRRRDPCHWPAAVGGTCGSFGTGASPARTARSRNPLDRLPPISSRC